MSQTIAHNSDSRIVRNDDGTMSVHVRADKVPNANGYGHAVESGNITRTYGRMMVRKYVEPAQGDRLQVGAAIDAYYVGTDLWREYPVAGFRRLSLVKSN